MSFPTSFILIFFLNQTASTCTEYIQPNRGCISTSTPLILASYHRTADPTSGKVESWGLESSRQTTKTRENPMLLVEPYPTNAFLSAIYYERFLSILQAAHKVQVTVGSYLLCATRRRMRQATPGCPARKHKNCDLCRQNVDYAWSCLQIPYPKMEKIRRKTGQERCILYTYNIYTHVHETRIHIFKRILEDLARCKVACVCAFRCQNLEEARIASSIAADI